MREASVEMYLKKQVEVKGGLSLKLLSNSMRGLPDRLVLLPQGKMFFVELKASGKKPRPEQLRVHNLLKNLGVRVYIADSKEKIKEILHNEICTAQVPANGD